MFSQIHQLIAKHGIVSTYKVVTEGLYDPNTSTVVNSETNYAVTLYRKHIRANQFNFPNLIGKDISLFYLSPIGLSFVPTAGDYIVYDSQTYKVDSVQKHAALGQVELYRIIGSK
jgi:hypothetical protein